MIDAKLVASIADLFTITAAQVASLDGMGEASANKVMEAIHHGRFRESWRLIHGLGINHVGEQVARSLAKHFGGIDGLRNASVVVLRKVDGVGPVLCQSIADFFGNASNQEVIRRLQEYGVQTQDVKSNEPVSPSSGPFIGKSVCVTGKLSISREQIEDKLRSLGAKVVGSVSKKTDYLIAGEDAGSKLEKAEKAGVKILTEAEFDGMVSAS